MMIIYVRHTRHGTRRDKNIIIIIRMTSRSNRSGITIITITTITTTGSAGLRRLGLRWLARIRTAIVARVLTHAVEVM